MKALPRGLTLPLLQVPLFSAEGYDLPRIPFILPSAVRE